MALRRPRRPPPGADPAPPETPPRLAALRLLGRRDYTAAEIRDRLTSRGYPEDDVNDLISRLVAERLVDDRRAAAAHVRSASKIKRRGRARIERELLARGLDRAAAHDAVSTLSPEDETAAIRAVVQRKRFPATPTLAERRRMFQHLLRRGFRADAIGKVLGHRDDEDE